MSRTKLLKLCGTVIFTYAAVSIILRSEVMASSSICEEPKNVRITEKEFIFQGDRLSDVRKMREAAKKKEDEMSKKLIEPSSSATTRGMAQPLTRPRPRTRRWTKQPGSTNTTAWLG